MNTVTIRPYDPARDEPFLRACIIELQETERAFDARLPAGTEMVDAYTALILRRCSEWQGEILVAEGEDGTRLGIATIFAAVPNEEPDEPPGTFALLNDLVVLPACRRTGTGRALLKAAEAYARQRGAAVLRLEVMAGNAAAAALYGSAGFEPRVVQLQKDVAADRIMSNRERFVSQPSA